MALISLVVQKALLPLATWLWIFLIGPVPHSVADLEGTGVFFAVFGVITLWIFVSAWMDMRQIVQQYELRSLERDALAYAGLKQIPEIPFDLIFCIGFLVLYFGTFPAMLYDRSGASGFPDGLVFWVMLLEVGVSFAFVAGLVLTAFVRRRQLLNNAAVQPSLGPLGGFRNQPDKDPAPA